MPKTKKKSRSTKEDNFQEQKILDVEQPEEDNCNTVLSGRYYPILYKIFEYLPDKDFHNARLVCSSWNKISLNFIKKEYDFLVLLEKESNYKDIRDLTLMFKENKDVPFLDYRIRSNGLKDLTLSKTRQETLSEFFGVSSPHITKLSVDDKFICMWSVTKGKCFNFQSLECLEFCPAEENVVGNPTAGKKSAEYFRNVVSRASNLKKLSLRGLAAIHILNEESDFILSILKEMSSLKHLEKLEVELANSRQLNALKIALTKLKVDYLDIRLTYPKFSTKDMNDVLDSQKNVLKHLKFSDFVFEENYDEDDNDVKLKFPRMESLKTLQVIYDANKNDDEDDDDDDEGNKSSVFAQVSYDDQFPVLTELSLDFHEENENLLDDFVTTYSRPSLTVAHLKLPPCPEFDSISSLTKVAYLFPKLKKLELSCNISLEDLMEGIKLIRQLEELKVNFHYKTLEHELDVCFPCTIGRKILKPKMDPEEEIWNKEETYLILKIVELHIRKSKLPNLNVIRFTCLKKDDDSRRFELLIQKKCSGEYAASIQVGHGIYANEKCWAEL